MFDCTLEDYGAEALVQSFGVPDYPGEHYGRNGTDGRRYSLNLEVRMVNGKFKTFEFDVTDQVKDNHGCVNRRERAVDSNDEGWKAEQL